MSEVQLFSLPRGAKLRQRPPAAQDDRPSSYDATRIPVPCHQMVGVGHSAPEQKSFVTRQRSTIQRRFMALHIYDYLELPQSVFLCIFMFYMQREKHMLVSQR